VILDVVYNHTGEGNEFGPTLSFRGIDNASYYVLASDRRKYVDYTGCGNSLNIRHPRVLQMVMDSLRYWVEEMHVDGFRFDLTSTLGREPHGFDPYAGFFDAVLQDPVLSRIKLIAEPWDIGLGGYQLGNYPAGWAEWNDRFRDTARRFWRGDANVIGELAGRLTGSADVFQQRGRRPWASINFITAHDGFTLADLVSYTRKRNDANGENNRDGTDNNLSWNCGVEGPSGDATVRARRYRDMGNLLATLLLAQGTPMLTAGDEFARTQHGNNNAYCQDNEVGWVDWESRDADDLALAEFVRRLLQLRREHALFRRTRFLTGQVLGDTGLKDVTWLSPEGHEMLTSDWNRPNAHCLGAELFQPNPPTAPTPFDHFVVLASNLDGPQAFRLPAPRQGQWRVLFDTARPDAEVAQKPYARGETYPMLARSFVLLQDQ
jgi:glycogen operon protein